MNCFILAYLIDTAAPDSCSSVRLVNSLETFPVFFILCSSINRIKAFLFYPLTFSFLPMSNSFHTMCIIFLLIDAFNV